MTRKSLGNLTLLAYSFCSERRVFYLDSPSGVMLPGPSNSARLFQLERIQAGHSYSMADMHQEIVRQTEVNRLAVGLTMRQGLIETTGEERKTLRQSASYLSHRLTLNDLESLVDAVTNYNLSLFDAIKITGGETRAREVSDTRLTSGLRQAFDTADSHFGSSTHGES